ncbi:2,3-dihydroxybiphenyl 1,2-dioxygenase [Rhizobium sp. SJZ105]|uniref:VOC family protein n=1 Tax=Rhizobium sp. SJZ105 TaxID=2572678 RepID=UPI0011A8B8C2|nr:VOC family protein [Rhizobium sp. SJZ105]TWC76451.1 2,3-dihydroxybiphenyl 1,2-dioxygenase [Rhizobium sp. SJZ105]
MEIQSLGYIGVRSQTIDDWRSYGTGLLGLQLIDKSRNTLAFRMDDRKQRIMVRKDDSDGADFFGWEVADAAALDRLASRLDNAGVCVGRLPASIAGERHVRDGIVFLDPAGNRVEVFYGAAIADMPFSPGRSISGFRTGPLGMGHAVLTVERIDEVMPFYVDLLGFKLSDFALRPFKAFFFHINSRHHSLALIETGKNGIHHLMMELFNLDDVGQGYDLAQGGDGLIGATLGRHTNDFMTSFYAYTPAKFMVEYGWGGREIDPPTWEPVELQHGPSLWGHDRTWLSDERREEARQLRLGAARAGVREPVQVMDGNHTLMQGACPWWDATMRAAE